MLHIATAHHLTDKWVNIQLRYIKKYTTGDYRIYACTPFPARKYEHLYDYCTDYSPGSLASQNHADRLHYLTNEIFKNAADGDLLLFLDGDAFPIREYLPFIAKKVKGHALVAIRRDENNGDLQPHPSFCATTVRFWKAIDGDWSPGYCWKNKAGNSVTDAGGNLLKKLGNRGWYPLLRSNTLNLHPLWFGVYGDIVYHHGAGFRDPISRIDLESSRMSDVEYAKCREYQKNYELHNKLFSEILRNEDFYRQFTGGNGIYRKILKIWQARDNRFFREH